MCRHCCYAGDDGVLEMMLVAWQAHVVDVVFVDEIEVDVADAVETVVVVEVVVEVVVVVETVVVAVVDDVEIVVWIVVETVVATVKAVDAWFDDRSD